MKKRLLCHILLPLAVVALTLLTLHGAQAALLRGNDIDAANKWAWATNAGWINFDPPDGGVHVYSDHLEGYAWGENVGWIRLGTYTGGGAHTYANTSATNYGVNMDADGNLSGYAWGTNIGWINFAPEGHAGVSIDLTTGDFSGYAWSESVGWISFNGPDYKVQTAYTVPQNVTKDSPNGATGLFPPVSLQWNAADDADYYEYCYDTVNDDVCNTHWVTSASPASLSELSAGATYYWQMRACNDVGCAEADGGTWWDFTMEDRPQDFEKQNPLDGSKGQPISDLTLNWEAISPAPTGYEYCVGLAPGDCSVIAWTDTGTTSGATVGGLQKGSTYFWQVRAYNFADVTYANNGEWWKFETRADVGAFQKVTPANSATDVPTTGITLDWSPASAAGEYHVIVGSSSGATDIVSATVSAPTTAYNVGAGVLEAGTRYYWQVMARNALGERPANEGVVWDFVTAFPGPGAFRKLSPASWATGVPVTGATFEWQEATSTSPITYSYCIGTASNDCSVTGGQINVSGDTSVTYSGTLDKGRLYYWQAFAHNAGGVTAANGGTSFRFTTETDPLCAAEFHKRSPTYNSAGLETGVLLKWYPSSDASSYRVCVGTGSGTCNVLDETVTTLQKALSGLQHGTTYFWQVYAVGSGCETPADGGSTWVFTVGNLTMNFSKSAPANGATDVLTDGATLTWEAAPDADNYQICLGTQPGGCEIVGWSNLGDTTSYNLPTLLASETYWWQVRAIDDDTGESALADEGLSWYFSTRGHGPGAFNKIAPTHMAFGVPTDTVTFEWAASADVDAYELCVGHTANVCDALPSGDWLDLATAQSYTLNTDLSPATTYFWQVRAVNTEGYMPAKGGWWNFSTVSAGDSSRAFGKINPENAVQVPRDTLTLRWGDSAGADDYQYCVSSASAPGSCDFSLGWQSVGVQLTTVISGLDYAETYWWQVKSIKDGVPAMAGEVPADNGHPWHFTIEEDPGVAVEPFSKVEPSHGANGLNAAQVTFSWGQADGAVSYAICVGTQAGLCDLTGNGYLNVDAAQAYTLTNALQIGGTYWWQVRALDSAGRARQANQGNAWYFSVDDSQLDTFGKRAPQNGTTGVGEYASLSWDTLSGATEYRVCVGLIPGFCDVSGGEWQSVSSTGLTAGPLARGKDYYWQVRGVTPSGVIDADDSIWWKLSTENPPIAPDFYKQTPVHMTTGVPTASVVLTWTAATSVEYTPLYYELCLGAGQQQCSWMKTDGSTAHTLSNLTAGKTYWWQIRAIYEGGAMNQADDGAWHAFKTVNAPTLGTFDKLIPTNGATIGDNPTLTWEAATVADHYQLCVGRSEGVCDALSHKIVDGQGHTLSLPNGTYWWQVTAVDDAGNMAQANGGDDWSFVIQPLKDPVDNPGTYKAGTTMEVLAGETLVYNLVFSNTNTSPLTATVTDTFDSRLTFVDATPDETSQTGNQIVWQNLMLPAQSVYTLTVELRAPDLLASSFSAHNSYVAEFEDGTTLERETDPAPEVRTQDSFFTGSRKLAQPESVEPGDTITYSLVLSNGWGTSIPVTVTDALHPLLTYVSSAPTADSHPSVGATGVVTWENVSVPAQSELTLTLAVEATGPFTDTREVENEYALHFADGRKLSIRDDGTTINTDATCVDNFETWKDVAPTISHAGELLTYTLWLSNSCSVGSVDADITDTLPSTVEWVSGGTHTGGIVTWQNIAVAAGERVSRTLTARVSEGVTETKSACNQYVAVFGDSSQLERQICSDVTAAALQLEKTAEDINGGELYVGDLIRYEVQAINSTGVTLTQVVITDDLPSGVSFVAASRTPDEQPDPLVWRNINLQSLNSGPLSIRDIGPSATWSVVITARVTSGAGGAIGGNYAHISGIPLDGGDPITNVVGPIVPKPNDTITHGLELTKTVSDLNGDQLHVGETLVYQLTAVNTGTTAMTDVVLYDALPISVTLVGESVTCSAGATCGSASGVVSATVGSLSAGASLTLTFRATADDIIDPVGDLGTWQPDPAWICNAAQAWSHVQGEQTATACIELEPRKIYLPLTLKSYN